MRTARSPPSAKSERCSQQAASEEECTTEPPVPAGPGFRQSRNSRSRRPSTAAGGSGRGPALPTLHGARRRTPVCPAGRAERGSWHRARDGRASRRAGLLTDRSLPSATDRGLPGYAYSSRAGAVAASHRQRARQGPPRGSSYHANSSVWRGDRSLSLRVPRPAVAFIGGWARELDQAGGRVAPTVACPRRSDALAQPRIARLLTSGSESPGGSSGVALVIRPLAVAPLQHSR